VFSFTTITFNIKTCKLHPKKKNDSLFQGKRRSSKSKEEDDA